MPSNGPLGELAAYALNYANEEIAVRRIRASLDIDFTTMMLLLSDPPNGDVWNEDCIYRMKLAIRQKATELGLPFVVFTLIAESEEVAKDFFPACNFPACKIH
jgi:hypothetical protein